jgi:hypothetical protein
MGTIKHFILAGALIALTLFFGSFERTHNNQLESKKEDTMSNHIVFITTLEIHPGKMELFKEAAKKSAAFAEENGPQLIFEVFIDEGAMRAHGFQVHRDSESILAYWKIGDPYMREVMQYITTRRVDVYGQPNEAVMENMRKIAGNDVILTVTPRFTGFVRF